MFMFIYNAHFQEFSNDAAIWRYVQSITTIPGKSKIYANEIA